MPEPGPVSDQVVASNVSREGDDDDRNSIMFNG